MRILIGTPIHEIKDYSLDRWLKNIAELTKVTPAFLLLVDNSPGPTYLKKVEDKLKKHGIKDFKVMHIEVNQANGIDERIGRSREVIRQFLLDNGFDVWFSWESDQIIPADTLEKLAKIMDAGKYSMVHPNSWNREHPKEPDAGFGVCLIDKFSLQKFGFLLTYPDMRDCWHGGEEWFKRQVIKSDGSYVEIFGVIEPILHLNS